MEAFSSFVLTEDSPEEEAEETPPSESGKEAGFHIPTLDISQDREEEIFEMLTNRIVDNNLETPAMLFLIPFRPISPIASQIMLLPFAPLLEAFDIPGFDYVSFLKSSDNIDQLVKRIEAQVKIRDEAKQKDKVEDWFSKLMKKIGR